MLRRCSLGVDSGFFGQLAHKVGVIARGPVTRSLAVDDEDAMHFVCRRRFCWWVGLGHCVNSEAIGGSVCTSAQAGVAGDDDGFGTGGQPKLGQNGREVVRYRLF